MSDVGQSMQKLIVELVMDLNYLNYSVDFLICDIIILCKSKENGKEGSRNAIFFVK